MICPISKPLGLDGIRIQTGLNLFSRTPRKRIEATPDTDGESRISRMPWT